MNKLSNTAKVLDRVFKVLQILIIILGIFFLAAMAIAGVGLSLAPDSLSGIENILILGPVELTLAPNAGVTASQSVMWQVVEMAIVLVCLAAVIVFIKYVRQILVPMMEGKPFHNTVSRNLKKLAWVEIAIGIAYNVLTVAETIMVNRFYQLSELFSKSSVTEISSYYEIDLSFLITAAVFFLLSYIFSYGAQLQKLSDETL